MPKMKMKVLLLVLFLGLSFVADAGPKPSVFDLVGSWDGTMEFGKFKFRMILHVAKTDGGKIAVTMDNPERGMKGMPVSAVLYNYPSVRFEIDQFETAFNGNLNQDGTEIAGEFEQGPSGKPVKVTFKSFKPSDIPEPEKVYTFAAGEPWDIRGYWKATLEAMPGMSLRVGLKIGRLPDRTFSAAMDVFDHGAADVPATSVSFTNSTGKLEWQPFQIVFNAKLSEDGKQLSGDWKQGPRATKVNFDRLAKPETALPEGISFTPDRSSPEDIRGNWKGTLEVPDGPKLRLAIKIGKAPDDSFAGTMASLDQGGREMPTMNISFTNPAVRLEWKGIRGVYQGTLNQEGTAMEGKWEQGGKPLPLKLERTDLAEEAKKP
jgi:hypothetical protein